MQHDSGLISQWYLVLTALSCLSEKLASDECEISVPFPSASNTLPGCRTSESTGRGRGDMNGIRELPHHLLLDPRQKPATGAVLKPLLLHCRQHGQPVKYSERACNYIYAFWGTVEVLKFRAEKT